jgi:electron transfer flavoprotein beta subunit
MINPNDLNALETAIQLKEQYSGEITVITMGPPQADKILYEAYAMGADRAVLISDPALKGADTYITTKVLKLALTYLADFDVIFTGYESIDGNTGQVPFQLSEALEIPLITQFNTLSIENQYLIGNRIKGHEFQKIKVPFPLLLTTNSRTNTPRYYNLTRIRHAYDLKIQLITLNDLHLNPFDVGSQGSPTKVQNINQISHQRKKEIIEGTDKEISQNLIELLTRKNLLKI